MTGPHRTHLTYHRHHLSIESIELSLTGTSNCTTFQVMLMIIILLIIRVIIIRVIIILLILIILLIIRTIVIPVLIIDIIIFTLSGTAARFLGSRRPVSLSFGSKRNISLFIRATNGRPASGNIPYVQPIGRN
jgi:hypothetical protein